MELDARRVAEKNVLGCCGQVSKEFLRVLLQGTDSSRLLQNGGVGGQFDSKAFSSRSRKPNSAALPSSQILGPTLKPKGPCALEGELHTKASPPEPQDVCGGGTSTRSVVSTGATEAAAAASTAAPSAEQASLQKLLSKHGMAQFLKVLEMQRFTVEELALWTFPDLLAALPGVPAVPLRKLWQSLQSRPMDCRWRGYGLRHRVKSHTVQV